MFLFGILIEITLIRPTYGNDMYSLILTFILSIVLQNAYLLIFGPYPNKPPQLDQAGPPTSSASSITATSAWRPSSPGRP